MEKNGIIAEMVDETFEDNLDMDVDIDEDADRLIQEMEDKINLKNKPKKKIIQNKDMDFDD